MEFRITWIFMFLLMETLHIQASYEGPQLYLDYYEEDTLEVEENTYRYFRFWVNVSSCKDPDELFRLEVQTSKIDGTYDNEGRVVRWKNKCKVTFKKSVECISDDGPAELFKTFKRYHKEVVWTMTWKDQDSKKLNTRQMRLKLNVIQNNYTDHQISPPLNITTGGEEHNSTDPQSSVPKSQSIGGEEKPKCEFEANGSIQKILVYGVKKSTFDIYNLCPNETKSIIIGCEYLEGKFDCSCKCNFTLNDPKTGNFSAHLPSANNTCEEKECLKYTCEDITVECKSNKVGKSLLDGSSRANGTSSTNGTSTTSVAKCVGIVVGVIAFVLPAIVVTIVLIKKKNV